MTVEYHPAVQDELLEIRDYYNGESVGLGGTLWMSSSARSH